MCMHGLCIDYLCGRGKRVWCICIFLCRVCFLGSFKSRCFHTHVAPYKHQNLFLYTQTIVVTLGNMCDIYIYIYTYIYKYIYIYIYLYIYICYIFNIYIYVFCVCIYEEMHTYIHTYIYIYIHTHYVWTCLWTCSCAYAYIYIYIYIYTYIYICMNMYTHTMHGYVWTCIYINMYMCVYAWTMYRLSMWQSEKGLAHLYLLVSCVLCRPLANLVVFIHVLVLIKIRIFFCLPKQLWLRLGICFIYIHIYTNIYIYI